MSGERTAYLNARLLDPDSNLDGMGAVLVEDHKIIDFGPHLFQTGAPSVNTVIDCKGACLCPGLVDMRVHAREPGEDHKETLETAADSAVAGGITSFVCLPTTTPVIDNEAGIQYIARRAREIKKSKIYCYGTITKAAMGSELTEFGLLSRAGAVGFSDGEKAIADPVVLQRALGYSSMFHALLIQHPEEPRLAKGVMNKGEIAARLGLDMVSPVAEIIMVERDLRLLEAHGGRLHFSHITTAESVEVIRKAKRRGLQVSCDTAPHYFVLNETAIGDYRTFAKVSPPLRGEFDRQAIIAGLVDGTIDCIASDHAPQDRESKRLPFAQAAYGIAGLQTLLPLTLGLYHAGDLSLLAALAKITAHPAKLLGLEAGKLKKGAAADLLIFDPDQPTKIDRQKFRGKSRNTPFDGMPVQGEIHATLVDGRVAYASDTHGKIL